MRTLGQTQRQPGDRAHEALLINAENYHYFEHTQAVRSHLINGIYKFSSLAYDGRYTGGRMESDCTPYKRGHCHHFLWRIAGVD
jgi:hypothetical protein